MSGRAAVLSLVVLLTLSACSGLSSEYAVGWAEVRFDGVTLGASGGSVPRVKCRRWDDRTNPSQITDLGSGRSNWRPGGDGPTASLRLRFPARFMSGSQVGVRFGIGSSVYEKEYEHGDDVRVKPRWKDGRAVLTDIPLVSGDPYEGKSSLKRLVVEWHCQEPGSALAVPPPAK